MSDRAALYTVVRPAERGKPVPLGDIDGAGTSSQTSSSASSTGSPRRARDGTRVVRAVEIERDGDDLFASCSTAPEASPPRSSTRPARVRLRQIPGDVQLVRTRLPLPAAACRDGREARRPRRQRPRRQGALRAGARGAVPARCSRASRSRSSGSASPRRCGPPSRGPGREGRACWSGGAGDRRRRPASGSPRRRRPGRARRPGVRRPGPPRCSSATSRGDAAALPEILRFAGLTFEHASVGVRLEDGTRGSSTSRVPRRGRRRRARSRASSSTTQASRPSRACSPRSEQRRA